MVDKSPGTQYAKLTTNAAIKGYISFTHHMITSVLSPRPVNEHPHLEVIQNANNILIRNIFRNARTIKSFVVVPSATITITNLKSSGPGTRSVSNILW